MTSRRTMRAGASLVAAAVLALGAAVAMPLSTQAATPTAHHIGGTLQAGFAATAPTTLMVQTSHYGLVSVSVSSTTKLVRRFNGTATSLAEFSAGDKLVIAGTFQSATSFSATAVKDASIQRAATFMVGTVTAVQGSTYTVSVVHGSRYHTRDPFRAGQSVTLTVSSSTPMAMANGAAATPSSVQVNMRIAAVGVVNRVTHTFISVAHIRILS